MASKSLTEDITLLIRQITCQIKCFSVTLELPISYGESRLRVSFAFKIADEERYLCRPHRLYRAFSNLSFSRRFTAIFASAVENP